MEEAHAKHQQEYQNRVNSDSEKGLKYIETKKPTYRYNKKRDNGEVKKVSDPVRKDAEMQRKYWRERQQKCRERKRSRESTSDLPLLTPASDLTNTTRGGVAVESSFINNGSNVTQELQAPSSSVALSCNSPSKSEGSVETDMSSSSDMADIQRSDPQKQESEGLKFAPGLRLEAKDLGSDVWYGVKVVEVDREEREVLIHFEKWSNRYDEWIQMDSSRLRPVQDVGSVKKLSKIFKVGDDVMATWSDSRKYRAKVNSVLSNDKYEVTFYDGFSKTIKGARMTKYIKGSGTSNVSQFPRVPFEDESHIPAPVNPVTNTLKMGYKDDPIGTKEERRERKRKINVAELFHQKKRPRLDEDAVLASLLPDKPLMKKKRAPRRRRRKPLDVQQSKIDNADDNVEAEKKAKLTSMFLTEPVGVTSELNKTVVEPKKEVGVIKKRTEVRIRLRRKVNSKSIAGQPRRRRRINCEDLKGRAVDAPQKGILEFKMSKKLARRRLQDRREASFLLGKSRKESLSEHSEEETPLVELKVKKKDVRDAEHVKPSPKPSHDDWEPEGEVAFIVEGSEGRRKSIIVSDKRLPEGWKKHTIQRMTGHSAGKWDVFLVNPEGRKFRTRQELRNYFEERGETFQKDLFDFSLGRRKIQRGNSEAKISVDTPSSKASSQAKQPSQRIAAGRSKVPFGPGGDTIEQQPVRRVKTLLPKVRPPQQEVTPEGPGLSSAPSPPPPHTTSMAHALVSKLPEDGLDSGVIVAGLKIQMENDAFKCPKEMCNKNFRKENLLQMHIKYYHPEYNKFMGSTPNVADLAYARTIGEPVEELLPKSRCSVTGSAFREKINRFEASRKAKSTGSTGGAGGDCALPERKKQLPKETKQLGPLAVKKSMKGEVETSPLPEVSSVDTTIPTEEKSGVEKPVCPPVMIREEPKEQPSIKTLLPVIRTPSVPDPPHADRPKSKVTLEEGDEYIDVLAVPPKKDLLPVMQQPSQPLPTTPVLGQQITPIVTKSVRAIRRRYLSDYHMEPLFKRRKPSAPVKVVGDVLDEVDVTEERSLPSNGPLLAGKAPTTYRFSKKKMPVVHLEKLQVTTDSNGHVIVSNLAQINRSHKVSRKTECEERSKSPPTVDARLTRAEQLRREEIINCTCGYMEEDGLMIQCDLCLCWQHGLCNNIEKETEVPEKYVCPICLNPARQRRSLQYLHDQDWLKDGSLPSLSFRSKNPDNISQVETILKRSHELTGTLLQMRQVIHSLRVKVNIAEKTDHPKLYLWAKSWEKNGAEQSQPDTKPSVPVREISIKEEEQNSVNMIKREIICKNLIEPSVNKTGSVDPLSLQEREKCRLDTTSSAAAAGDGDISSEGEQTEHSSHEKTQSPSVPSVVASAEMCSSASVQGDSSNDLIDSAECRKGELTQVNGVCEGESVRSEVTVPASSIQADTQESEKLEAEDSSTDVMTIDKSGVTEEEQKSKGLEGQLLHQALTDSTDVSTTSSHSMLQLPICQTELMHFASSMANKLNDSEVSRIREPPRAPQPEAPIDPVECRLMLLDHIDHYHQQIDARLTSLEARIAALEALDPDQASDETAEYYPQTKQTVQMLLKDLTTIRNIASIN